MDSKDSQHEHLIRMCLGRNLAAKGVFIRHFKPKGKAGGLRMWVQHSTCAALEDPVGSCRDHGVADLPAELQRSR